VVLQPGMEDSTIWRWSVSGTYSASSAYAALLHGQTVLLREKEVWKVKGPREHKFFVWFVIQDRCWMSERSQCHGMDNSGLCALCAQNPESIDHLVLSCVVSEEIWFVTLRCYGWQALAPTREDHFVDWWLVARKLVANARKKAFDSLVVCCIWLQRNAKVFRGHSPTVGPLSRL
jgi:hypothetical protein